jgi:hypothetical protein
VSNLVRAFRWAASAVASAVGYITWRAWHGSPRHLTHSERKAERKAAVARALEKK